MDIKLNTTTHDLTLSNGDLVLVDRVDAIQQHVKQRYLFFFGEWFLDNTKGVPYYQSIFVKNPNLDLIDATLRNVALQTPGILQLNSFDFGYDNATRTISPSFQAESSDGPINFLETVGV